MFTLRMPIILGTVAWPLNLAWGGYPSWMQSINLFASTLNLGGLTGLNNERQIGYYIGAPSALVRYNTLNQANRPRDPTAEG